MPPGRLLFIDAYDSFSNSIIALLRAELSVTVEAIKIDDPRFVLNDEAFHNYLDQYDAVVAGPGPGHPAKQQDAGLISKLWALPEDHLLPVLGICLGFQSLCAAFNGRVTRLREPRHGIMALVTHCKDDVFAGTGKVVATQYHSFHVVLHSSESNHDDTCGSMGFWSPSSMCPDLVPLAWDLMSVKNGSILMAARHRAKPFHGVQYHPESICTNKEGQRVVKEWWGQACAWNPLHRRPATKFSHEGPDILPRPEDVLEPTKTIGPDRVQWKSIDGIAPSSVANVVDSLRATAVIEEPLILESGCRDGKPVNPETGRFSIIGLPDSSSTHIRYSTSERRLKVTQFGATSINKHANVQEAFSYIEDYMKDRKAIDGPQSSPFWGGLIGFISYEAGLESIDVATGCESSHPDLCFVFMYRSIVLDHVEQKAFVQSLHHDDEEWIASTTDTLEQLDEKESCMHVAKVSASVLDGPERADYCSKVQRCQSELRAGESYELCLTDQSVLKIDASSAWSVYRQLRKRNPAPFGAYLQLHDENGTSLNVAGSSPERFLSWTRDGTCQFRPIKGTVSKGPGATRAKAEEILGTPKERAENLMIVDLIRHDLAGVPGVGQVRVPKLMAVEEYETVFQLVSVIEGQVHATLSPMVALAASLPPGSMTGAPKKRSCEILKEIEQGKPRGLYSGVLGYFDVGGGGDFSVIIRTAFRWGDDAEGVWRVGAGGAITALSEAEAEWEEMVTKRESVLKSLS